MRVALSVLLLVAISATYAMSSPPDGYNGAGIMLDNSVRLYVYRMSTMHPDMYKRCQAFTGPGYAFMVLGINTKSAYDKYTWHCWFDTVEIELDDGRMVRSIDLSDWDGFYRWSLADEFACTKTVYPGETDFLYLAFYPSFSWKNVKQVSFRCKQDGGIWRARWMTIS